MLLALCWPGLAAGSIANAQDCLLSDILIHPAARPQFSQSGSRHAVLIDWIIFYLIVRAQTIMTQDAVGVGRPFPFCPPHLLLHHAEARLGLCVTVRVNQRERGE